MSSKPFEIRWSHRAQQDINDVLLWFQHQSAMSAGREWFERLQHAVHRLKNEPSACPLAAEAEDLDLELHELLFGKRRGQYRILFIVQSRSVVILHVRHSARDAFTSDDLGPLPG